MTPLHTLEVRTDSNAPTPKAIATSCQKLGFKIAITFKPKMLETSKQVEWTQQMWHALDMRRL